MKEYIHKVIRANDKKWMALKRIDDFHTAITSDIDSDSDTITYSGDDDVFSSNYTLSSESIAQELLQAKNK